MDNVPASVFFARREVGADHTFRRSYMEDHDTNAKIRKPLSGSFTLGAINASKLTNPASEKAHTVMNAHWINRVQFEKTSGRPVPERKDQPNYMDYVLMHD